jgi:16S rRNA (cytidine1402-2'-O)-methyltransferase
MSKLGCLYIVAVPIGNPKDITLRALEVLKSVNGVICEELREGSTLLKRLGVQNELLTLNEHNEPEMSMGILMRLMKGETMALVSDCGTPVFADPGHNLVRLLTESGVAVVPVPGPSSLMAALSVLDFKLEKYVFGGFLSPKEDRRKAELQQLRAAGLPVVLMDTPYRMVSLVTDVLEIFGAGARLTLACDLTLPTERVYRGPAAHVLEKITGKKGEFILVVQPQTGRRS